MEYPSLNNQFLVQHAVLLRTSFYRLLGKDLIDASLENLEFAQRLFEAPFAVLSHNTEVDPVFNYANLKGLELFELSWNALLTLPSRFSAETINQQERTELLAQVTRKGYIDNYQGVRISSSGRRFQIGNAVVWNVYDNNNIYRGQAAYFKDWIFL